MRNYIMHTSMRQSGANSCVAACRRVLQCVAVCFSDCCSRMLHATTRQNSPMPPSYPTCCIKGLTGLTFKNLSISHAFSRMCTHICAYIYVYVYVYAACMCIRMCICSRLHRRPQRLARLTPRSARETSQKSAL